MGENGIGGSGALVTGNIFLQIGTLVKIVVGQVGNAAGAQNAGGGGATYIFAGSFGMPLMVAGRLLHAGPAGWKN